MDWNPQPCVALPSSAPPYLIGIVKEFQHCEDAGPDEQPHLAPDVTCGVRLEKLVGSGH